MTKSSSILLLPHRWIVGFILFFVSPMLFALNNTIADKIQFKFESNLFTLPPVNQSHYAVRLYRLTGNKKYIYPIIYIQLINSYQYKMIMLNANRKYELPKDFKINFPNNFKSLGKWKKRSVILKQFPEIMSDLRLLYILTVASHMNLLDSPFFPESQEAILHLKQNKQSLRKFLLNPTYIKYSSAQIANFVVSLQYLDIIDITDEYKMAFQKVYPDNLDNRLSDEEYTDKIYGLTHFIIAASSFYQHKVSAAEFQWIYEYFDKHIDEIIKRTRFDVIVEVGICYLLTDITTNQSLIDKINRYISSRFDQEKNLIIEPWDYESLAKAEHRNVLTILYLKWTNKLYQGPDLLNSREFKDLFKNYLP